jgi:hypothetical protein
VKNLLQGPLRSKFLLALPWTVPFAREQVKRERANIDKAGKVIVFEKEVLRGVSRRLSWPGTDGGEPCPVYVHIYYNLTKADERKNALYGYAASLLEPAKENPDDKRCKQEFQKKPPGFNPKPHEKHELLVREL